MDIQNTLTGTEEKYQYDNATRYQSSKNLFFYFSFLFFLNFFFVGAQVLDPISQILIPYTYSAFILSFLFFLYYLFTISFKNKGLKMIIGMVCVVLLGVSLLPILGFSFG